MASTREITDRLVVFYRMNTPPAYHDLLDDFLKTVTPEAGFDYLRLMHTFLQHNLQARLKEDLLQVSGVGEKRSSQVTCLDLGLIYFNPKLNTCNLPRHVIQNLRSHTHLWMKASPEEYWKAKKEYHEALHDLKTKLTSQRSGNYKARVIKNRHGAPNAPMLIFDSTSLNFDADQIISISKA